MPCNSDHMKPNQMEIQINDLYCVWEEVKFNIPLTTFPYYKNPIKGPIYGKGYGQKYADKLAKETCEILREKNDKQISKYTLEVQIWWRDHKQHDLDRLSKEIEKLPIGKERWTYLLNLSDYEQDLLINEMDKDKL